MSKKNIYFSEDSDLTPLNGKIIAVLGYGNQGRAQALNLRDSKLNIIIGNREDADKTNAIQDGFAVYDISTSVMKADIIFILLPDEIIPKIFKELINPNLKQGAVINFASGYNIAFNLIKPPDFVDVIMIAPKMIGVGVRERFLKDEGFYSFVCVHQNSTGNAKKILLALAKAIGTLKKCAIELTMKQEAILDLYNEQAFGPAFGRVLLSSIEILIDKGLPPEAVLCEMYLSEEMAYTYRKMAQIGLVNQTQFHSNTSQYGAMSRGIRYFDFKRKLEHEFEKTYEEIESGKFAKEWQKKISKIKFRIIKFFAMKQNINQIEKKVRKNLRIKEYDVYSEPKDIDTLLKTPEIQDEINEIKTLYEY